MTSWISNIMLSTLMTNVLLPIGYRVADKIIPHTIRKVFTKSEPHITINPGPVQVIPTPPIIVSTISSPGPIEKSIGLATTLAGIGAAFYLGKDGVVATGEVLKDAYATVKLTQSLKDEVVNNANDVQKKAIAAIKRVEKSVETVKQHATDTLSTASNHAYTLFGQQICSDDSSITQSLFSTTVEKEAKNLRQHITLIGSDLKKIINDNLSLMNKHFIIGMLGSTTMMLIPATVSTIGIAIAQKYIAKKMFSPTIINKQSSNPSYGTRIKNYLFNIKKPNLEELMIISDQLKAQLNQVIKMTANTKKNGGFYENILLHGAPGTGKTLFAQSLAETCGMDYMVISAADISQYFNPAPGETTAAEQINALFKKASQSKRGTIIFFDEAECFLADRTTLNQAAYNALTAFLTQTGTPSNNVMVICATNIPKKIDTAVLSRFGMHIEFPLPDQKTIASILSMHIKKVFEQQNTGKKIAYTLLADSEKIEELATKLVGQSGRTIQKFANQLRQYALSMDDNEITETAIEHCLHNIHAKIA